MLPIPPLTRALIIANAAVFLGQMIVPGPLISAFALWPIGPGFAPWQLITYGFLHGGLFHLLFNMLALYMFGSDIERIVGARRFLHFYLSSVLTAAIAQLVFSAAADLPPYPTIGASGGVFGVLLAFALYFPRRTILLIFPPIPMPAWLFVILYGLLTLYMGITGTQQGVAHFAHLGGMLGGYLTIQYWRGRWPFSRPHW